MMHPSETQLALFAGGDLGLWQRWSVSRHVSGCAKCRHEIAILRAGSEELQALTAELPKDLNWNRLSQEMTGNIRVGLAAGEAIARFDRPAGARPLRLGWNAALVLGCATAVFVAAFWISLPRPQVEHLANALGRIRTERIGRLVDPHPASHEVVLEASASTLQVKENGGAMSLLHPQFGRRDGIGEHARFRGGAVRGRRHRASNHEQGVLCGAVVA